MKLMSRWSLILPVAAIPAAMVLSLLNSPERGARAKIGQLLNGRPVEVTFEPLRFRGVLCGRVKDAGGGVRRHPFVYIDHYSAEAPQVSLLLFGREDAKARRKYYCSPA